MYLHNAFKQWKTSLLIESLGHIDGTLTGTNIHWGAHGVMVIITRNGQSDLSSNPRWGCLLFE